MPDYSGLTVSVLGILLLQCAATAQTMPEPLVLKNSLVLQEAIAPTTRSQLPSFVSGDLITGRTDLESVIEGNAMLRRGDIVIKADRLEYNQPTDLAKARGNVRINRAGNVYEGPLMELKLDAFEGFFNQPRYHFLKNAAHGQADQVDFLDENRAVIHNASYTTCKRLPGPDWLPDWILRAGTIKLDNAQDVGQASDALLSFKGLPLLPIPYLTFPLSDQRKSGVLPPTVGQDNANGWEVVLPYYWNIAPNRDANFTPTLMTKRGINLGTEFRYLEPAYTGNLRWDWMPSDQLRNANRWGLNYAHKAHLPSAWTDAGVALNLNLNRVSDDNYWRDFTHTNTSLTQRLLSNDATLAWRNGLFASSVRTLKWQTLQDASAPITPPYDRLPQISTSVARVNHGGFDYTFTADYTRFVSNGVLNRQPNGQRAFSLAQLSYPLSAAAGFVKPKLQWHATSYQFDAPLADGQSSASRILPTFSLDTGLVFERDTDLLGRSVIQTLEPRAFYVKTPYRDQLLLPNYDSGANDFNLATIYTENAFVGNDRISDSNLLTLGLTTRFLGATTGAEAARFGVAQRLRFTDQNVALPGTLPALERISDLLLGASIHWDPRWSFDAAVQFNPSTDQSVRSTLGARYNPGSFRTLTAAYRYQRNLSEQIDVGWQWPLRDLWSEHQQNAARDSAMTDGHWYSVGRLNYSMNESKLVDSMVGFEYDAGCWLGRMVLERMQTSTITASQRIMFQLEFVGFSKLGVNPLKSLKDNIPNYQNLRTSGTSPSRFSNFD